MKAKLVRSDLSVEPKEHPAEFVAANSEPTGKFLGKTEIRRWKWGTIIEHPRAWMLVRQGVAIPDDDECRKAAGLTEQQMQAAQAHYDQLKVDGSYMDALIAKANRPRIIDEDEE